MKTASSQMCTAGCMNSCETYVLNIWFVTDGADSRTWQTWRTWRTCPPGDGQFHSQLALPIFSRCTCCDVSSAAHLADIVQCVNGMAAGSGAHNCVVPIPITHTMKVMETRHSRRVQHITGHHMHHHMMMVKAKPRQKRAHMPGGWHRHESLPAPNASARRTQIYLPVESVQI